MRPYHDDYGLPEETRIKAIVDSEIIGISKAAALNRVATTSIYRWKRAYKTQSYARS